MNLCFTKYLKQSISICFFTFLLGCSPSDKPLHIGAAPWPNFEFSFLANELNYLNKKEYSFLELPSPTSVMQAFQTGKLDVAFLTLDEVLTLVSRKVDLRIISVVDDFYDGAALLTSPEIKSLKNLKLHSIGYENNTTGALLLDEFFNLTNMSHKTTQLYEIKQNEVVETYLNGTVDALIVKEPIKQKLLAAGAQELMNSNQLNMPIPNVIIARGDVSQEKELEIAYFLKQYYRAYKFYERNTNEALKMISVRLQLYPDELKDALSNIKLVLPKQALLRLSGSPSNMELQIKQLSELMSKKRMFDPINIDISTLISTRILERTIYE